MAISLAHWASGKITITALEAGLLPPTAIFTVSGVSPSGHNGTFGINLQIYGTLTVPQTVNPGLYSSGGTIKLSSGGTQQYFVTGATWAANEITFSTPGSSTFPMGSTVTVAGVIPAGYNGTYTTDSSPTPAKITFVQPANPGADGTTGTIQYTPNILAYDARTCYASY
jgi:hypothetical protein